MIWIASTCLTQNSVELMSHPLGARLTNQASK